MLQQSQQISVTPGKGMLLPFLRFIVFRFTHCRHLDCQADLIFFSWVNWKSFVNGTCEYLKINRFIHTQFFYHFPKQNFNDMLK